LGASERAALGYQMSLNALGAGHIPPVRLPYSYCGQFAPLSILTAARRQIKVIGGLPPRS